MTPSLVAVAADVSCSRSLVARALEVQRMQQRNLGLALVLSVALHVLALLCYFLFPSMQAPIDLDDVDWKRPGPPRGNDPIELEEYLPPGPGRAAPKNPTVVAGKIVAVPDVLADATKMFADQKQLARDEVPAGIPGEGTGEAEGWGEDGAGGGSIPEIETEPPIFVPVEREPMLVRRVAPRYPEIAQRAGIEGRVTVRIWVTKEGTVRDVRLIASDNELLSEAALEAARQFLFTPAYMNSGPVAVWVGVPFTFKLKN